MIRAPPIPAGFDGRLSSAILVCVFVNIVCYEIIFLRKSNSPAREGDELNLALSQSKL